jgi:hypothetical protein
VSSWNDLKERIEDKLLGGFTSSETYAIFCNEGNTVDLASLQRGAREVGLVHLTRADIRSILRRMCLTVGAVIDSATFYKSLGVELGEIDFTSNKKGKSELSSSTTNDKDSIQHLLVSIKKDLEVGFKGKDLKVVLEKGLSVMDVDNDGALTLREFIK